MSGQSDDECGGCSRRSLLQGLAVSLPVLLVSGCGNDSVNGGVDPVDAGLAGPDAQGGTGSMLCGSDLCVDLTHPQNAGLNTVGGSRIFSVTGDKIVAVRSSETTFTTLTAVCTHSGCSVKYVKANDDFACPCHGSKFAIDGSVTRGPAARDLTPYLNTFDALTSTLTIKL